MVAAVSSPCKTVTSSRFTSNPESGTTKTYSTEGSRGTGSSGSVGRQKPIDCLGIQAIVCLQASAVCSVDKVFDCISKLTVEEMGNSDSRSNQSAAAAPPSSNPAAMMAAAAPNTGGSSPAPASAAASAGAGGAPAAGAGAGAYRMPGQSRSQRFYVTIPRGVKPGQHFAVLVNGQQMMVKCPENNRPGDRLIVTAPRSQAQQYVVTVPANVRQGQQFRVMINNQEVMVTCPRGVKPGQRVTFQLPQPATERPPPQPAPNHQMFGKLLLCCPLSPLIACHRGDGARGSARRTAVRADRLRTARHGHMPAKCQTRTENTLPITYPAHTAAIGSDSRELRQGRLDALPRRGSQVPLGLQRICRGFQTRSQDCL